MMLRIVLIGDHYGNLGTLRRRRAVQRNASPQGWHNYVGRFKNIAFSKA